MRTLDAIQNPEKRRRIARETLEIYAPLAERIGMHEMKDELEDLAFAQLNPDARGSIVRRLSELRHEGSDLVATVLDELSSVLAEGGVSGSVTGRATPPYSSRLKSTDKNVRCTTTLDTKAI